MKKIKDYLDPPKILVLGFAIVILIGAFLLTLPIATEDGKGLSFLNALFTATSATCVTGLVVVDTGDTFSMFGEIGHSIAHSNRWIRIYDICHFFIFTIREENLFKRKIAVARILK